MFTRSYRGGGISLGQKLVDLVHWFTVFGGGFVHGYSGVWLVDGVGVECTVLLRDGVGLSGGAHSV